PAYFAVDSLTLGGGDTLPGDFDGDGQLTALDINQLTQQAASGEYSSALDLNQDNLINFGDITFWIRDVKKSWIGDTNLDGEFNSSDLVTVLAAGTYEQPATTAVWTTGDFNGDGRANTSDLVAALADGGYENGTRAAVVPEPSGIVMLALGLMAIGRKIGRI
ncbi:MAG: PEP-CTERM sorting domain-containing protein, partial [Planctomycetales bacterium]|nr:PEP-CTERM sorting domain-containing protein [Planctomycetales bacterium]